MPSDYDDARYKELKGEFEDVLESYERMLSKTKYLAGDKMTAADVYHLPCIRALNKVSYLIQRASKQLTGPAFRRYSHAQEPQERQAVVG